ncbi:hypothetical protein HFE03_03455 [Paenibacillus sp. EKM102P]|uniref:phage head-tail connector protein n=1 Tax=unclassified Paenibacillus TaxID=185978 RepID=UPI00142D1C25|nr:MULTISPECIES: phage head-tail connector protein [unclassified Paenibacillus]KAF6618266.1 hypothetical protein HFE00_09295 [Paenibacillus sp. EKM101P]KAF6624611.1 hypothetical protein HFE03_03455 [Paenibacillus sp. EKM102P]KAF6635610.1 hypothetical protein HFE01_01575 [Paenibacillus sp. EKM10P]KAF6648680.1 hypothetical protein HFE02_09975 [Paenibacillus sp. EKM11P]
MLTTLQRAKSYLSIPLDDTSQDFTLLTALGAASEWIERECNRSFEYKTYRQTLDGPGTKFLRLRNFPIHSVSLLHVDGVDKLGESFTIESENGMLFRRSGWPFGARLIEVEYLAGYILPSDAEDAPAPTLPCKYEWACVLLAQTLMREQGVTSERVGDISVTYKDEGRSLPGAVKALIQL